jgi:3-methyladenine DNA glycosylase Mpg
MIKTLSIAVLLASSLVATGAQAQTAKLVCSEAHLEALDRGAVAMGDVTKREAAMKSSKAMRQMYMSKDLTGCEAHLINHVRDFGDVNN